MQIRIFIKVLEILSKIATRAFQIYLEAFPFLLLGVAVSALIEEFVPVDFIKRIAPKNRLLAPLYGIFMGLVFPVCECGSIPVARRLSLKGLPHSCVFSFLFASPIVNPIVILSTARAFGFSSDVFFWRASLGVAIPLVIGFVAAAIPKDDSVVLPRKDNACGCGCGLEHEHKTGWWQSVVRMSRTMVSEFAEVGSILAIGCLITGASSTLFPKEAWLSLAQTPSAAIMLMIAMAIILSLCSTVDAMVIRPFYGLFPTSSIIAFLVLGPMFDIKTVLVTTATFKRKYAYPVYAIAILLCLVASFALQIWVYQ